MNTTLRLALNEVNRRLAGTVLMVICVLLAGCSREQPVAEIKAKVAVRFNPNPPKVGENELEITVTDPGDQPVQLGMIKVEGNMNHAGMKPVFAELVENEPGRYAGVIQFTMGGDWFLLVTSEASPGGALNEKIAVPGVKAK